MSKFKSILVILFIFLNCTILITCDKRNSRRRRSNAFGNSGSEIDLNITVPYVFSARLYPYGFSNNSTPLTSDPTTKILKTPLKFLDNLYTKITIHKDGFLSFGGSEVSADLPIPIVAAFWTKVQSGQVYFEETDDPNILNMAQSEVNIQFRYGATFRPFTVVIVTWETSVKSPSKNIFQIALILGDNGCFAHFVYSKLSSQLDAVAGFTSDDETSTYFVMPGSGTSEAYHLVEKSNIGIPGEWLFRIDYEQIYLCGAGFQGLECVDSCQPTQWYLDCSRSCHCADGNACSTETGQCPSDGKCNPGWTGEPICDQDIDECTDNEVLCPTEQPDCVNTPGAYLCLCFEYDNKTNLCVGNSNSKIATSAPIEVPVMKLQPQLPQKAKAHSETTHRTRPPPNHVLPSIGLSTTNAVVFKQTTPRSWTATAVDCANCDIHAQCTEKRQCQCLLGWKGDGYHCEDVDECINAVMTCGVNAECQNTPGSYQCICNVGFVASASGCTDVNECLEEGICKVKNQECINTDGGYKCQCAEGYTESSSGECKDIDECENAAFFCGSKATCINEPGSYKCDCFEGYQRNKQGICVDINECLHRPCHTAALCTNVEGSFRCECMEGFVGDGISCHETILYPISKNAVRITSNIPVSLRQPITVFGKIYRQMFISSQGLVSFDQPLDVALNNDISQIKSTALLPFFESKQTNNSILFAEIDENDATNYAQLTRASMTVQTKFRLPDFQAKMLYIITFNGNNTFQMVMAQNNNATFAFFLYDDRLSDRMNEAVMGISNSNEFMNIPVLMLADNSNIGQKGRWLYRIDKQSGIGKCPAGMLDPPLCSRECPPGYWGFDCSNTCQCADGIPCDFATGYCVNAKCQPGYKGTNCQEDIDECSAGTHTCHINANCVNSIGSYTCLCQPDYQGDGSNCTLSTFCHRNGLECSDNAFCDNHLGNPVCKCNVGYEGDGYTCTKKETTPTTTTTAEGIIWTQTVQSEVTMHSNVLLNEAASPSTVISTLAPLPPPTTPHPKVKKPRPPQKTNELETQSYQDFENNAFDNNLDNIDTDDESHGVATLLVVVVPSILCAIWLVLMAIIIAVCCRKRRQSSRQTRHDKYTLEMMGWQTTTPSGFGYPISKNYSHSSQFAYT